MDTVDIRIYATHRSRRLDYILSVVLGDLLGLRHSVLTDRRRIDGLPLINYSNEAIEGSLAISPEGLLFEDFLRPEEPDTAVWNNVTVLFPSDGGEDIPFDIFAAAFWMISRYEEHLPFSADRHGRFPASESLAFRKGFLEEPVIEIWARLLGGELQKRFPSLPVRRNPFRSLNTFDIDQAWAYRGKGVLRTVAGICAGAVRGGAMERMRVLAGREADPYDVFDYIGTALAGREKDSVFFLPFASWSEFDRNNRPGSRSYRKFVAGLSERYETGIHFSYRSAARERLYGIEARRFESATGELPLASRQHYLLLSLPDSYRILEDRGITTDYSMGYASASGFRAGISRPFRFYDLCRERVTALSVQPFACMDVTLKDYLGYDVEGAMEAVDRLHGAVRRVGGCFALIWHNSSLSEREGWEGWRRVFEYGLEISALQ